jgi:hypothetical protein
VCGQDWSDSEYEPATGSCEHSNELAGLVQGEELADWLRDCQLSKKLSAHQSTGLHFLSLRKINKYVYCVTEGHPALASTRIPTLHS